MVNVSCEECGMQFNKHFIKSNNLEEDIWGLKLGYLENSCEQRDGALI